MKRWMAVVLMVVLVIPMYSKDKKSKAEKQAEKFEANAREQFSRETEINIEQNSPYLLERFTNSVDGTRINNVRCVNRTRCGVDAHGGFGGLCLPGDRRVLMIQGFTNPNDMIAFANEVKNIGTSKLKGYGFTYLELRSQYQSATFPDGILDIPVQ
jgi:hypothetical protein